MQLVKLLKADITANNFTEQNNNGYLFEDLLKTFDPIESTYERVSKVTEQINQHWVEKAQEAAQG